jgi:mRNA-degrading endonuclease RelE of RelBE toxin-antitoxin system
MLLPEVGGQLRFFDHMIPFDMLVVRGTSVRIALCGGVVRFIAERLHGSDNPRTIGKPLRTETLWRCRVGDLRVFYRIEDDVHAVLVVEPGHRGEVYR